MPRDTPCGPGRGARGAGGTTEVLVAAAAPFLGRWRIVAGQHHPEPSRPASRAGAPDPARPGAGSAASSAPDRTGADDARGADDAGGGGSGEGEGLLGTSVTAEMVKVQGAKTLKRTPLVIAFFLVFNYLVLPQLGGAREAADQLSAVNPVLLLVALGLEMAALVAYAQLTRVTLPPEPHLSMGTVLRIQLSTKAVTNLVPGGSAAGSTLGLRLLTQSGVSGAASGFSIATVGLGSAVVLNLLLWVALLISIPLDGFNPVYGTAAIVGMLLMALFAGLVVLLMKGQAPAIRVVRAVAGKLPFLDPDTAERFMLTLVDRLRELIANPSLIRRGVLWASVNWLLDAAALWVFIRAFGPTINPVDVIVAFCVANILAVIPLTPGGLGVVEATLIATLVGFGLGRSEAAISVVTYRLAQFWLPIPLGAISYATLRVGPRSLRRMRRAHPLRELADDTRDVAGVHVWDIDGEQPGRRSEASP
ncbi:YbhN family protein [Iamia majanohamensis]|uniref:YbhN family protein n=1 Tax=Iamia majanohamensis TaxID=467976 RepID=A0AAE9YAJ5_9ACTN|nr:YbhN family protein [Iamia majanohamensis]WCO67439.1 YbhN family protein [Iamia majanohamensis]